MSEINNIVSFLIGYLQDKNKAEKSEELVSLLKKYPRLNELLEEVDSEDALLEALRNYGFFHDQHAQAENRMWENVLSKVNPEISNNRYTKRWYSLAAASVLLFITGLWFFYGNNKKLDVNNEQLITDSSPGSHKAQLRLEGGEIFDLSREHSGVVIDEGVKYDDGSLLWENVSAEPVILELSTPKGGEYQITLSDGTKIWLNADSRLRYSSFFTGNERKVELEGEAFFEVSKDSNRPFIVKTPFQEVEVLGTEFNVHAYEEDAFSSVYLLDGSVHVLYHNSKTHKLKPGQQSVMEGESLTITQANAFDVLAWKEGEFAFNRTSLKNAMMAISRWYDVQIEVSEELNDVYIWGRLSRYSTFQEVMEMITLIDSRIRIKNLEGRVKLMK